MKLDKKNAYKNQIGMTEGKAIYILRKKILFNLVQKKCLDICFRCDEKLEEDDYSIDHKESWLLAEDPKQSFYDLSNIAFSHLSCNIKHVTRNNSWNYLKKMGKTIKEVKKEKLGLNHSTAQNRLSKKLIYSFQKEINGIDCFRCKKEMDICSFTVDHIEPWINHENPKNAYFELENISFSHQKCNSREARRTTNVRSTTGYKGVWIDPRYKNKAYRVTFNVQGNKIDLGGYRSAEEAAVAYDRKMIELFGEDAITNKSIGTIKY